MRISETGIGKMQREIGGGRMRKRVRDLDGERES